MIKKSFLALPKPVVACILAEPTARRAMAVIKNGEFEGAHAFAVHLEALGAGEKTEENFRRIAGCTPRPVMFLHYRATEKWPFEMSDGERVETLLSGIKCGAACIDLTADTYAPSPDQFTEDPEALELQRGAIERAHELGGEVVLSSHTGKALTCGQAVGQMKAMEKRGADIVKLVTMADTEEELAEAVKTTLALHRELKTPFIHLCGGKYGMPHRFFGPALGSALTFCVERYTEDFTSGQPPVANMLNVLRNYNWNINDL